MTSKVDFGTLLAKADKNTNNAQKLLKEQDILKRIKLEEQRKAEKQREAALAIINKKKFDEAQKQANKPTQTNITSNVSKANISSQVEKKSDSAPVNKANGSASLINKSKANSQSQTQQQSKNATQTIKKNDKKTQVSQPASSKAVNSSNKQINVNKNGTSNVNKDVKAKKPLALAPAKPKLTFEEMLKLADVKQKELTEKPKPVVKEPSLAAQSLMPSFKSKAPKAAESYPNQTASATTSTKLAANKANLAKSDINFKKPSEPIDSKRPYVSNNGRSVSPAQQSSNSFVSKLTPEQIEKLRQRQQGNKSQVTQSTSTKPNISNHITSKDQLHKQQEPMKQRHPISNGLSSKSGWELAMSYVKKKDVKINHPIKKSHNDELDYVDDEEEDEYDSEMDDFIDDEEEHETKEKGYSKYIREIFKYNPTKYKDYDEDDLADMETDFHSQLKEESRSLRLGIMEDLEEERKEAERLARLKKGKRKSESDDTIKKKLKS